MSNHNAKQRGNEADLCGLSEEEYTVWNLQAACQAYQLGLASVKTGKLAVPCLDFASAIPVIQDYTTLKKPAWFA